MHTYVADTLLVMTESQGQFGLSEDPAAPQIDRDRAVCSLRTLLVDEVESKRRTVWFEVSYLTVEMNLMYCPNCGKDNSNEQRFCRSCGLSLQPISRVLGNELSESGDAQVEVIKRGQKKWLNPLVYGFLLLTLGIVIVIFGKTLLGEQLVADIGTVVAVLGIGLLGFKGVSLIRSQSGLPHQSKALPEAEVTAKLPPASEFGSVPSITEHTTRPLKSTYGERKAK